MTQKNLMPVSLRVPGEREYALVVRTALSGLAVLMDFDMDALDDLRMAADECLECLLGQGRKVGAVQVEAKRSEEMMNLTMTAEFVSPAVQGDVQELELTSSVLETLARQVDIVSDEGGCVQRIEVVMCPHMPRWAV